MTAFEGAIRGRGSATIEVDPLTRVDRKTGGVFISIALVGHRPVTDDPFELSDDELERTVVMMPPAAARTREDQSMSTTVRSTSPDGRFEVRVDPWEAHASQWVETPEIYDTRSRRVLLGFSDANWSLESATWTDREVVVLRLRKWPGDHEPPHVDLVVDCARRTGKVGTRSARTLKHVEPLLAKSLTWK